MNPTGVNQYTSERGKRLEYLRDVLFGLLADYRDHYKKTKRYRQPNRFEMAALRYLLAMDGVPVYYPKKGKVNVNDIEQQAAEYLGIPSFLLKKPNAPRNKDKVGGLKQTPNLQLFNP